MSHPSWKQRSRRLSALCAQLLILYIGCFSMAASQLFAQSAGSANPAPAATPVLPSVDEIIARNLAARGGQDKFNAIQTIRLIRHVAENSTGRPTEYDVVLELKRPNLVRLENRTAEGVYVFTFDGHSGWSLGAGQPESTTLSGEDLKRMSVSVSDRLEGEFADYQRKGYRVELLGVRKSGAHDCYGLLTTRPDGTQSYRCFDTTTFLDIELRDANSTQMRSDFRPVDGILFAHRFDVESAKGRSTATMTKVEINPPLDDAVFGKPAAVKTTASAGDVSPSPAAVAASLPAAITAKQVRAARQQLLDALQNVMTCPSRPFDRPCSFAERPTQFKISKEKIQFWAPLNKTWGGPRSAFIDFASMPPSLKTKWCCLFVPKQLTYNYVEGKADKHTSDILFKFPMLEWQAGSPYPQKFMEAMDVLRAYAKSDVDIEAQEQTAFSERVRKWCALPEKPALPQEVHSEEVLAKDALTSEKNPELALQHFERGLAIEPLWPAGQLGAAILCGELQHYDCAVEHGQLYLQMLPDGPQSDVLRDKVIIWKDKLSRGQGASAVR